MIVSVKELTAEYDFNPHEREHYRPQEATMLGVVMPLIVGALIIVFERLLIGKLETTLYIFLAPYSVLITIQNAINYYRMTRHGLRGFQIEVNEEDVLLYEIPLIGEKKFRRDFVERDKIEGFRRTVEGVEFVLKSNWWFDKTEEIKLPKQLQDTLIEWLEEETPPEPMPKTIKRIEPRVDA